jgi:hypothetical protein
MLLLVNQNEGGQNEYSKINCKDKQKDGYISKATRTSDREGSEVSWLAITTIMITPNPRIPMKHQLCPAKKYSG